MREPRTIIEEAERAAAARDYVSAEKLLREAVRIQEGTLGRLHPELANTLNNLGIVCEITGHPVDAEHFFRRAVAIATKAFGEGHPLVVTSQKNLRDFCDARGKKLAVVSRRTPAKPQNARPRQRNRSFGRLVLTAAGPVAMLIMVLVVGKPFDPISPTSPVNATGPNSSPVSADAKDAAPIPVPVQAAVGAAPAATTTPITERPSVVRSQLCATLDDWMCDPSDQPVPRGELFFYTQVKSPSVMAIQHRWYQGNRLDHTVNFRIQPSDIGYRTYSRMTMDEGSAGPWRVELRTADGVLLREERFSVQ